MAVNLAKRRFKNLVAKEEYELENGPALKKKAEDAIKKNKEELEAHAKEQLERINALNSDPRYLGPPLKEEVWVGKKTQDKILDKVKNGFIGKEPIPEVIFDPETLEGDLSGRQEVIDPSVADVPAEVAAVNAANSKPIQKASAIKAMPQVKETVENIKAERKEAIKEKIEEKIEEKVGDSQIIEPGGPDGPPVVVATDEAPKSKKSTKKSKKG